jgi:hypothetical protein
MRRLLVRLLGVRASATIALIGCSSPAVARRQQQSVDATRREAD